MRLIINPVARFSLELRKAIPRRLLDRQKKRPTILQPQDKLIEYNPWQALQLMRAHTFTSFTETVDVCIQLGVNPKNGDQIVRGSAFMPAGLGKTVKVAVLCDDFLKDELSKAGADMFINNDIFVDIRDGKTDFDILFTTPEHLSKLKMFGKVLGPRGLMPNAKVGTLTSSKELGKAIQQAKAGQVNYRVDAGKNIHAPLGKIYFSDEQLLANFKSLMHSLVEKKPAGLKTKYLVAGYLKSTMGPRWKLQMEDIDPKNSKNIWDLVE